MTSAGTPGGRRRGAGRWWVIGVALLVVGAGCILVGLLDQQDPRTVEGSSQRASASASASRGAVPKPAEVATPADATPVVARPAPAPVELRIPAIGVSASVSGLGVNRDGTVEVPTEAEKTGWFRLGPSPGQMGSAVILGHVDSHEGPAVFYKLRFLEAGDRVTVGLADGSIAHFVVETVATYANERFPARKVYGSHGYGALQLVTCGGEYDAETGYQSNVVAYTRLVGTTPG